MIKYFYQLPKQFRGSGLYRELIDKTKEEQEYANDNNIIFSEEEEIISKEMIKGIITLAELDSNQVSYNSKSVIKILNISNYWDFDDPLPENLKEHVLKHIISVLYTINRNYDVFSTHTSVRELIKFIAKNLDSISLLDSLY